MVINIMFWNIPKDGESPVIVKLGQSDVKHFIPLTIIVFWPCANVQSIYDRHISYVVHGIQYTLDQIERYM